MTAPQTHLHILKRQSNRLGNFIDRADEDGSLLPLLSFSAKLDRTDLADLYARIVPLDGEKLYGRKYLAFAKHVSQALERARDLHLVQLENYPCPLDILDLGAGPGFFCYATKLYGHSPVALERPAPESRPHVSFPAILEYLEIPATLQSIGAQVSITETPALKNPDGSTKQFDLITAFSIMFNMTEGYYWSADDYRFFLKDLTRFLKPNGKVILKHNARLYAGERDRMEDDAHDYHRALGELLSPFLTGLAGDSEEHGVILDLTKRKAWQTADRVELPVTKRLSSKGKRAAESEDE